MSSLHQTVAWLQSLGYLFDGKTEMQLRQQAVYALLDYMAEQSAKHEPEQKQAV